MKTHAPFAGAVPWTLGACGLIACWTAVAAAAEVPPPGNGSASDPPPFARRVDVPEFPADAEWINTRKPLQFSDLRGKFVLLDFWTYCCINCMHVLPELKKLEQAYPRELVVVGIHSPKFEAEMDADNVRDAVRRYQIEHPVLNDRNHQIWRTFGVRSWPTLLLIDPEGKAVYGRAGEVTFETLDAVLKQALPFYRRQGLVDDRPLELLAPEADPATPLRYPGKILFDAGSQRLFIADSNHHRIVACDPQGKLLHVIGRGSAGRREGGFTEAEFRHPQGMALDGDRLYVADTENHLIRQVDLVRQEVTTLAGTGVQGRDSWPHDPALDGLSARSEMPWVAPPLRTALNSPWDLCVHGGYLWIAMAGSHQIWRMDLAATYLGPYAGNGREDIVDGPRLPAEPYGLGASSFAQPSGLAADEQDLFVADSEGSSVRAVPFNARLTVRTIVGTAHRPDSERLFTFGDQDGSRNEARLQHALGVAWHDGVLYVADTYNSKIKRIDLADGRVTTVELRPAPDTPGGLADAALLDEPAGIAYGEGNLFVADTNHHQIQVIDLKSGTVAPLTIVGLTAPQVGLAR